MQGVPRRAAMDGTLAFLPQAANFEKGDFRGIRRAAVFESFVRWNAFCDRRGVERRIGISVYKWVMSEIFRAYVRIVKGLRALRSRRAMVPALDGQRLLPRR